MAVAIQIRENCPSGEYGLEVVEFAVAVQIVPVPAVDFAQEFSQPEVELLQFTKIDVDGLGGVPIRGRGDKPQRYFCDYRIRIGR